MGLIRWGGDRLIGDASIQVAPAPVLRQLSTNSQQNASMPLASNPVIGNFLVCSLIGNPGPTGISDNYSNTWTQQCYVTDAAGNGAGFYTAPVTATGAGFTVTVAGGPGGFTREFSGVNLSTPVDGTPVTYASYPTNVTVAQITLSATSKPNTYCLAALQPNSDEVCTQLGLFNFTAASQLNYYRDLYYIASSTGTFLAECTMSSSDVYTMAALALRG